MIDLKATFESFQDSPRDFAYVKNKKSNRTDLHAFMLLDSLVPGTRDMVTGAEHDEIFLNVDLDNLAEKITEDQVLDLVRCGVMYNDEFECLSMFV